MAQNSILIDSLSIDAGSPPEEWLDGSYKVDVSARIISLWETTVCLIKNEQVLSENQREFLAAIHDHKVRTGERPARYES